MQKNVFLTGATGYIGGAIADALRAGGYAVIGLARSDQAARSLTAKGITPVAGDLNTPANLAKAASESDGVIHAGTTNDGRIDQAAVEAMLHTLRGSNKPFVYTSGIWVLGDTGGKVADESWPLNPAALVAWRPAMEQSVIAATGTGVRTVVIRPGIVYGRGGGIPAEFVRSGKESGVVRYVGNGENRWPVVHADDLADLYLRAFAEARAGELFHAADGSAFRVREIAEAAGGKAASWPLEDARKTLGAYADALVLDQMVSSEKAKRTLGWQPKAISIVEELRRESSAA
ncbi:MAG TPA: SDR family oxidoreductase [Bryobacteraceae bacterium]|nr:SDR family oxidoreductase [Bryobacteraceae bacterium]